MGSGDLSVMEDWGGLGWIGSEYKRVVCHEGELHNCAFGIAHPSRPSIHQPFEFSVQADSRFSISHCLSLFPLPLHYFPFPFLPFHHPNPSSSSRAPTIMALDQSIWSYSPSFALAIVVAILYLIPTLVLAWQTLFKYRSWFFLCVLIGSAIEVGGYACRAVSAKQPREIVRPHPISFHTSLRQSRCRPHIPHPQTRWIDVAHWPSYSPYLPPHRPPTPHPPPS